MFYEAESFFSIITKKHKITPHSCSILRKSTIISAGKLNIYKSKKGIIMNIEKYISLFFLLGTAVVAMDQPSSSAASILAPSIKNTINIPCPTTLCCTRNGTTLIVGTSGSEVCVCNPHAKEPDFRIPVKDYVYALDTNPQHPDLIAMQDASDKISVFDIRGLRSVRQIENGAGSIMLKYNNEGSQLLVTTCQNGCNLVDVRSKDTIAILPGTKINGAYYNPVHTSEIAIMYDEAIEIYDARAGKSSVTIPLTSALINLAFNKYGNKIIASCTGNLALFDPRTGAALAYYNYKGKKTDQPTHNKRLQASNVAFFPHQNKFIASEWNGWMILADVNKPDYHGTFQIPEDTRYPQFFPFTISPNGNEMPVSLTDNGVVYVFDVSGLKQWTALSKEEKTASNTSHNSRWEYCSLS